jgi:uncharacterized membrane protein (DUF2068 family)
MRTIIHKLTRRSRADRGRPVLPGTSRRRFRPKFHYELFVCGASGHMLVGTDAATVRPNDAPFVREYGQLRWYRCLRCDSWLPLPPPTRTARVYPPDQNQIVLPLRGKALRDKIVLRLIALDRALHFVLLALLALLVFTLASHRAELQRLVGRLNSIFYGSHNGHTAPNHGLVHQIERLVTLDVTTLRLIGLAAAGYALLEGAEAYGLWRQRRWAEYLTFIATTLFVPYELYDLQRAVTVFHIATLVVNVAILLYLLLAKRLFGLRGGEPADRAARERDSGWHAFELLTPGQFSDADHS